MQAKREEQGKNEVVYKRSNVEKLSYHYRLMNLVVSSHIVYPSLGEVVTCELNCTLLL